MIKLILFTALFNTNEAVALPPEPPIKVEARKRNGKNQRGRRRGGSGLR